MPLVKGAKTMTNLMSKKSFVDSNISINPQSLTDLTEGQKACLRLVVQHHTSKEIARKLGISRYTVDQRLDAARHKLNAASRKDAAKILPRGIRTRYPNRSYTKRSYLSPLSLSLTPEKPRVG
jgi:DNA-binding CsgD family transcriptional regulator